MLLPTTSSAAFLWVAAHAIAAGAADVDKELQDLSPAVTAVQRDAVNTFRESQAAHDYIQGVLGKIQKRCALSDDPAVLEIPQQLAQVYSPENDPRWLPQEHLDAVESWLNLHPCWRKEIMGF